MSRVPCAIRYVIILCWLLSHVRLLATPWTVARQAPLSMEFFRQEYWSGLPFPFPGDLPKPGVKPMSLLYCRWILYHLSHQGNQETGIIMLSLVIYFIHGIKNACVSIPISQFLSPIPYPLGIHIFVLSVCLFLLCK